MKRFTLPFLIIFTLAVVACSTPAQNLQSPSLETPANSELDAPVTERVSGINNEAAHMLTTQCNAVTDPEIIYDAFPSSFEGMNAVGDKIVDMARSTNEDGTIERGSNSVKTLTANDEYYLTFAGTDACGLNIAKGSYKQLVVGNYDWGYVKQVSVKGYNGLIVHDNERGNYALDFLLNDRLLVELTVDGPLGEADILRAAQQVNFESIERAIP